MPFVCVLALFAWTALTAEGYGAQSLSHIVEDFRVLLAAAGLGYVTVFFVDPSAAKPREGPSALMGILTVGAVPLRTFMPVFPEERGHTVPRTA